MAPSDLLMRRYYRAAKAIWRFNQILLANLVRRASRRESERKPRKLDDDFQVRERARSRSATRSSSSGARARSSRRSAACRTTASSWAWGRRRCARSRARCRRSMPRFRREPGSNRRRFMEILRAERLTWTLRRMSRYGVLGALPAGVRPHRRPDAARPLPRLHRGRAHPHGDPQPAALPHPALRPRVPAPAAS